jgi:transposase InsO family protein
MKTVLDVQVQGHRMRALLDSGAMGNYISPAVVNHYQLPWHQKVEPYRLCNIEGDAFDYNGGKVDTETDHLNMSIQGHHEQVIFDVMNLSDYDLILGHPWLWESNPMIDWRNGQLRWMDTATRNDHLRPEEAKFRDDSASGEASQESHKRAVQATTSKEMTTATVATQKSLQPGLQHKQSRKHDKRIKRTIALLKRHLNHVDKTLREQKETPSEDKDRMKNVPKEYHKYAKLFQEKLDTGLPEHSRWDHEICLKDGATTKFHKIYNLDETQLATLREYLDDKLAKGYIRPSKSEAGYPVMFVPKKNGKLRLVVDYRQLNDVTIKDRTPLPLISELRDRLHGKKYFTALDLKDAYNLIRIKPGDEWKTAFRTKFGLFEYLVMPFGLTNAPASFQRMINTVLREYLDIFVVVYLDDILIFSETLEEHKNHVHKVLQTLQDAKLLVEPTKSHFHVQKVEFLGHIITPNEVRMDPKKIESVRDWPTPKNVKDVQAFIGLANYYRRFVRNFGKIAAPLTNLTKGSTKFEWTEECQQAFDKIKDTITSDVVLTTFDPERQVELETDASDFAIGAQIGQRDDEGRLRPIAFYSKKLHGAELNYPIYDKEFLAIIQAFKEFRHYLTGSKHKVKVYTDHKNIAYFATTQELSKRQLRYAEFLADFDFEIIHRKGSENGRADALSRRPDYDTGEAKATGQLLQVNKQGNLEQRALNAVTYKMEVTNDLHNEIKEVSSLCQGHEVEPGVIDKGNGNEYNGKTWIPNARNLREKTIKEIHAHPTSGHQGIRRTLERIRRTYDYRGIKNDVTRIVKECEDCARAKAARHKPYGELKPLPVPTRPWESIAFDHITKLPPSKEPMTDTVYDSIFVVTDRLTKYGYFIPYKEASNSEELAYTFLKNIVSNHGLPEEIVSDRGTTFASKFWQALMAQLGLKHKLSTAYHPQTDGQTERLNQTLEQYLRCYINYEQDDWVSKLPTAQLAYNSSIAESTQLTPMYANYGYNPEAYRTPKEGPLAEKAILTADQIRSLHSQMRKELEYVRQRMAHYHNKKRSKGPIFERGDMVYLLRRNFTTNRPSSKLDHKKVGPFQIAEKLSDTNYRLSLPRTMKMHDIFHISLLEPAPKNARQQLHIEVLEEEYEPERILDKQVMDGEVKYLVKWKGYNDAENTWEPAKHLKNCHRLLRRYHQKVRQEMSLAG